MILSAGYYSELSHFATMNSTILATVSVIFRLIQCSAITNCYNAQPFFNCYSDQSFHSSASAQPILICYNAQSFSTAPVLSQSSCHSAQSLIGVTVLSHFPLQKVLGHSLVLQCLVIPYWDTVLSHSSLLQHVGSVGHRLGRGAHGTDVLTRRTRGGTCVGAPGSIGLGGPLGPGDE
jgi:hypothetical protein